MAIRKYRLKSGKERWMFSQHLGFDDRGKRVVAHRKGFLTKTDAKDALDKIKNQFKNGEYKKISKETYQDIYNIWLPLYAATVKESTLQTTMTMFKLHILPVFGSMKIDKINPLICQEFATGLSTFVKGGEVFHRAKKVIDYAYKLDLINSNPFSKVILPKFKSKRKMVNFLEVEDIKKLFSVIDDLMWKIYFRLLIIAGLRKSEALALHWTDINFNEKTLYVGHTLTYGVGNKLIRTSPKTKNSETTLLLDNETVKILKEYKLYTKGVIVFPNNSGNYLRPARPGEALNKYCDLAGINRIRVHDLRHTTASIMFESGATIKEVQDRLRHSSSKTTLDIYTHLTENQKQEAVDKLVKFIG